jgi:uncharacterized membrane protein YidH (DUF202 family)
MKDEVPKKIADSFNRTEHLANERTFLAWIRTNIGIMAFGFVIERFSFFLNQIRSFVSSTGVNEEVPLEPGYGYSSVIGVLLIAFGALLCALAFVRFQSVEKQIDQNRYEPPYWLTVGVTALVSLIGLFIVVYLVRSVILGTLPI